MGLQIYVKTSKIWRKTNRSGESSNPNGIQLIFWFDDVVISNPKLHVLISNIQSAKNRLHVRPEDFLKVAVFQRRWSWFWLCAKTCVSHKNNSTKSLLQILCLKYFIWSILFVSTFSGYTVIFISLNTGCIFECLSTVSTKILWLYY